MDDGIKAQLAAMNKMLDAAADINAKKQQNASLVQALEKEDLAQGILVGRHAEAVIKLFEAKGFEGNKQLHKRG